MVWGVIAVLISCFWGCGPAKTTVASEETGQTRVVHDRVKEENRERALKHFIDGALYDSKGEHAKAILEYQDAARYDQNPAIFYALSKDYSIIGKHALAAQAAKDAIRLDSATMSYRENLAQIFVNAFQNDLAVGVYEEMIQIDSMYTSAWYNLARLYQATRPLKALEIYEKLLDREGDTWEILLQTADLYGQLGRFNEAAAKYRRLLELNPSDRALQRQLAETYDRAGNSEEAIKILEKMIEVDDSDVEVIAALADVYLGKREYEKALGLYQRLLRREKDNPQIKLRVGIAYFGHVQTDSTFLPSAKAIFEEVATELPSDWRPFWYLGAIADLGKKDSLALQYFEKVTQMGGGPIEAWWFVGIHHFQNNEHQKVLDLMEKAQKLFPSEYRVYFLKGIAYSGLERKDEAVTSLQRALELNPNDVNTLSSLALTLDGMKRFAESDSLYERSLRVDPTYHIVLNNYGYSLAERGLQLERALRMALEAVKAEPENSSYLDTLGWIYFKLGRYSDAEIYVGKAIAKGDASAVVHEHLGDVYFKLGVKEKALEFWNKALEKDANNKGLKEKIERGTL